MGAAPQHRADPSWPQPHQIPSRIPAVPCATPCPRGSDPLNPSPSLLSPRGAFFLLSKPSELISSCPRSSPPPPPRRPPNSSPQPRRALGEGAGGQPALWGLVGPPPGLQALLRKLLLERKSEQDKNNPGLAGKHGPGAVPGAPCPGSTGISSCPGLFPARWHRWRGDSGDGEDAARAGPGVPPAPAAAQKPLLWLCCSRSSSHALQGRRCPCPRRGKRV